MTLREFNETDFTVGELYDLACANDAYDIIDEIYSADSISESIDEYISDFMRDHNWEELRSCLDDVNLDGNLYVYGGGYFEYECIDDDPYYAEDLKNALREYLLDNEGFDPADDDDDIELDEIPIDELMEKHEPEWFESDIEYDLDELFA